MLFLCYINYKFDISNKKNPAASYCITMSHIQSFCKIAYMYIPATAQFEFLHQITTLSKQP